MYHIVDFIEEGTVELVPATWVEGEVCAWPPGPGSKANLIKTCQAPCENWKTFKVSIKASFEKYEDGRRKLDLAQYTSDLESEQEIKKRRVQRPGRYMDDDTFDGPPLPHNFPRGPAQCTAVNVSEDEAPLKSTEGSQQGDEDQETSLSQAFEAEVCSTGHSQASMANQQQQAPRQKKQLLDEDFKQEVLTRLAVLRVVQKQHGELLLGLCNSSTTREAAVADTPTIKQPFEDAQQLVHFDSGLSQSTKAILIHDFTAIGGTTPESCTRRILRSVMVDKVASLFSFHGKKGKLAFSDLQICSCIVAAVKAVHSCNDHQVETAIKDWLRHAPARHRGSSEKPSGHLPPSGP
uniref:DUF4806 domain-containing protein n=1 Tax=Amblyomma sculptum TaxID=1581419 RepID=A0A1E1XPZ7_AMBSC